MSRIHALATTSVLLFLTTPALAQFAARSMPSKAPSVTTPASSGGGYQGADDCNSPHTNAGSGDVSGVPFTTGTTGTTGQNEAICYAFGSTEIHNDVWYNWTATQTGTAVLTTCNGTGVDTKIAVWPGGSGTCPADGSSLACNDDACGLQSTAAWSANSGTTYTFQIGTFPGAAGGSGTFDVIESGPTVCGTDDDGSTENALGFTVGGEIGWLQGYDCGLTHFTHVDTAYGTAMFPGSVTNGANSRVAVYSGIGSTPPATPPVALVSTTVVNGDTDILNQIDVGPIILPGGQTTWLMATADHIAGQFPGPMDQTAPIANSWVVGSTLGPGTMDVNNLNNNGLPPSQMSAIGFPANWLLRGTGAVAGTGTASCFGDGSGAPCGCSNESAPGDGGCLNSLGVAATLSATGTADVTNDTVSLTATNVRSQPGLFFQADNAIGGGAGATFGDGIRCCGQNVVRLQIVSPPPPQPSTANLSVTITNTGPPGTVQPGDKKCYQYWYRDPGPLNPCGTNFNLSNAVSITWNATGPTDPFCFEDDFAWSHGPIAAPAWACDPPIPFGGSGWNLADSRVDFPSTGDDLVHINNGRARIYCLNNSAQGGYLAFFREVEETLDEWELFVRVRVDLTSSSRPVPTVYVNSGPTPGEPCCFFCTDPAPHRGGWSALSGQILALLDGTTIPTSYVLTVGVWHDVEIISTPLGSEIRAWDTGGNRPVQPLATGGSLGTPSRIWFHGPNFLNFDYSVDRVSLCEL